jgi:hypothetical protein
MTDSGSGSAVVFLTRAQIGLVLAVAFVEVMFWCWQFPNLPPLQGGTVTLGLPRVETLG